MGHNETDSTSWIAKVFKVHIITLNGPEFRPTDLGVHLWIIQSCRGNKHEQQRVKCTEDINIARERGGKWDDLFVPLGHLRW